jgi:hypothetical protein
MSETQTKTVENLRFDMEHTLRAVLHFFGPEGAEKVTGHVMAARKARDMAREVAAQ